MKRQLDTPVSYRVSPHAWRSAGRGRGDHRRVGRPEALRGHYLTQLQRVGLPTDGVVVELDERQVLLSSLATAMRSLPEAERGRSLYISKMVLAGAVGLFDAALNYMWDEQRAAPTRGRV